MDSRHVLLFGLVVTFFCFKSFWFPFIIGVNGKKMFLWRTLKLFRQKTSNYCYTSVACLKKCLGVK